MRKKKIETHFTFTTFKIWNVLSLGLTMKEMTKSKIISTQLHCRETVFLAREAQNDFNNNDSIFEKKKFWKQSPAYRSHLRFFIVLLYIHSMSSLKKRFRIFLIFRVLRPSDYGILMLGVSLGNPVILYFRQIPHGVDIILK